jgi:hypothetical protein
MARSTTKKGGRGFAGKWNKAKESAGDGFGDPVPLDAGNYRMQLVHATVIDTDSKGRTLVLKWCVIDEDDNGVICTEFEGIEDDERIVWVQRKLISLGVDLDEIEVDSEDDLIGVFEELIKEYVCARVRVIEKDGYTNMRVLKAVDVDDDELVDAEEALKGGGSSSSSGDSEEEEEEEEEEKSKAKRRRGKKKEELTGVTKDELEVGDKIKFTDPESGDVYDAEITSLPPKGKNVQILASDAESDADVEVIEVDQITEVVSSGGGDDDEGEDDDGDEGPEVGDEVEFKKGRKKATGVVRSVEDGVAKVKISGQRKLEEIDVEKLTVIDEE